MEIFSTISPVFVEAITLFKIISLIVSFAFITGSIYSWFAIQEVSDINKQKWEEHFSLKKERKSSIETERWKGIKHIFSLPDQARWRTAIIDADIMLEDMVTLMGYQGIGLGDKLKSMQRDGVPWVQAAWDVHLLRNKLAHEGSRYPLNSREAYRAFKIYENIFIESGYIS